LILTKPVRLNLCRMKSRMRCYLYFLLVDLFEIAFLWNLKSFFLFFSLLYISFQRFQILMHDNSRISLSFSFVILLFHLMSLLDQHINDLLVTFYSTEKLFETIPGKFSTFVQTCNFLCFLFIKVFYRTFIADSWLSFLFWSYVVQPG